ncbi:hypothetical protein CRUP_031325, partial [Coryphaenoides rupestris]
GEEGPGSPTPSSTPSSSSRVAGAEPERGGGILSDGGSSSSDGSLAARVAKLLQSETCSSVTMTTSTSSTADQEDARAREWLRLKMLGQQCEPLPLDAEDRRRIEEIKRELLLQRPLQSLVSTDTESSTVSSLRGRPLGPLAEATPPTPPRQNLESRVREIAVREGVTLPPPPPTALTSISLSTCCRSPSPSPAPSPAPEPLRLTHLTAGAGPPPPPSSSPSPSPRPGSDGGSTVNVEGDPTGSQNGQLPVFAPPPDRMDSVTGSSSSPPSPAYAAPPMGGSSSSGGAGSGHHVSRLHLTLTRPPEHRAYATGALAQDGALPAGPPSREFSPLPRSTTTTTGPAGLSCDTREPMRGRVPQRADTSTLFRAGLSKDARTSTSTTSTTRPPQSFTPPQRPQAAHVPAPPPLVLLPYKPRGSEELFYVPRSEASLSPERPCSTAESTHP